MQIKLQNISYKYRFRKKLALKKINYKFPENGFVGIVGPNGSGKSTLFGILTGSLKPQSGYLVINGKTINFKNPKSVGDYISNISYLPQKFSLDGSLTVEEAIKYSAWARGVSKNNIDQFSLDAIKAVNLLEHKDLKIRKLSGGMRQRVGIACAISNKPKVLLLDEPTNGLDPEQTFSIRKHLKNYAAENLVIMSTHMINDLSEVADHLLVIKFSNLLFADTFQNFLSKVSEQKESGISRPEAAYYQIVQNSI